MESNHTQTAVRNYLRRMLHGLTRLLIEVETLEEQIAITNDIEAVRRTLALTAMANADAMNVLRDSQN